MLRPYTRLLTPDPADAGGDPVPQDNPQATPTPPPSAPPPAATAVVNGRTERELQLETDLQRERDSHTSTAAEKKQRELRIAELEDQLHQLKTAAAATPADNRSTLERFLDGEE